MRSLVMGVLTALALVACSGPKEKPTAVVIKQQENLKTKPEQAKQVDPARKVLGQFNAIEVLDIRTATVFYPAHKEHQDYLTVNPDGYCNHRIRFPEWPKLESEAVPADADATAAE